MGLGLSGVKFEAAYASTLGRTQETARIILSQRDVYKRQSYGASIPSIMPLSGLRRLPGQALKRPRQRNSTVHNSSPPL